MKKYLVIVFIFSFIAGFSQNKGKIEIIQNEKVDELVEKHRTLNEKIDGIPGYRLQIFSESGVNSRNRANKEKEEFLQKFPEEKVYIIFQSPNYKVRIGDFRSQFDALGVLHKIQQSYPSAFIVNDKIKFPEL